MEETYFTPFSSNLLCLHPDFFFVNYYIKFLQVAKKPSVPAKNTDFWKVDLNGSKWKTFEILGLVGLEHDFSRILRVDFSNGCQPKNRRFLPRKWMVKIMETLKPY